jgi:hypothetical protein
VALRQIKSSVTPQLEVILRPRYARQILATLVALVIGLDLFRIILRFGFGVTRYSLTIVNVNWEGNLPTWSATILLAATAAVLGAVSGVKFAQRDTYRWHWVVLVLGFLLMSLDEAASIHEGVNDRLRDFQVFRGRLANPWVVLGIVVVAGVAASFWRFLRSLPAKTRRDFITAGAVYVSGAVAVETFWSVYVVTANRETATSHLIRTLTEVLEQAGLAMFIVAVLSYLASELRGASFRVSD